MNDEERRWSGNVGGLKEDGLHGWREHESPEQRHAAIERTIRQDGYATAIRRLGFLRNVADRENNEELHRLAEEDQRWAGGWEDRERHDEDRRRDQGTHHRVRGFDREVEGRQERVRPHLAKNPRRSR